MFSLQLRCYKISTVCEDEESCKTGRIANTETVYRRRFTAAVALCTCIKQ